MQPLVVVLVLCQCRVGIDGPASLDQELKEQIEAAKRGLAEMSPVITAADPLFQPVAMPAADFAGLAVGHEGDAPDALDQNMVANDDMATDDMATGEGLSIFPSSQPVGTAICPVIAYEHGKC